MAIIKKIIMKIMDTKATMVKDLEEITDDKTTIGHVMEIIEVVVMEMIGGKVIEIGTIVDKIEVTMMAKMRIMAMIEITKTIEGTTDQEEIEVITEVITEVEEVVVMVGTEVVVVMITMKTMISRTEDAEEMIMMVEKVIMKMNQRKGRFIFHQSYLMTKVPCLETMYPWE